MSKKTIKNKKGGSRRSPSRRGSPSRRRSPSRRHSHTNSRERGIDYAFQLAYDLNLKLAECNRKLKEKERLLQELNIVPGVVVEGESSPDRPIGGLEDIEIDERHFAFANSQELEDFYRRLREL